MNQITISYFGCIDKNYSRNRTNIDGLRSAGAVVHEVIVHTPVTPLNASEHLEFFALLRRLLRKLLIIPTVLLSWKRIRNSQIIFVGYPGQFDVPIAYIIAKCFKKKLVFDPVILISNTLSNDIGVLNKKGAVNQILYAYEKFIMNLPDVIIASTSQLKTFFSQQVGIPSKKIIVSYLAADDQIYRPGKKSQIKKEKFQVVYYGMFTPLHGVSHIIEAARICQNEKNIVFQMVGKGQLYEQSRELADSLHLKNICFYPELNENNALELLQSGSIFLGFLETSATSQREIPNKVYQGMALGKVVITSDTPAIRTVFHHKDDIYLVPPGNGRALAKAILELSKDNELLNKIGTNALEHFRKNFTPSAIGRTMIKDIKNKLLS